VDKLNFQKDFLQSVPLPNTIEECHQVIRELLKALDNTSRRLDLLEAENKRLNAECEGLKERLNINATNSSLAPSQSKKKPKNKRPSSGKSSGGQFGHKGTNRELLPLEQVDNVVKCELPAHCECGGCIIKGNDSLRHQVNELPNLKLDITEYQLPKGECQLCRAKHIASLPTGVTWGITGPKLTSFMTDLVSRYGLSRRELTRLLEEYFRFQISLGSVFNKQKLVNQALEKPVLSILPVIKESESVHVDETGHNRDGKRHWMWVFTSKIGAYFSIQASRGKKAFRSIIGDFKNILVSDRYNVYNSFKHVRQICWAHLKRDFTRLSEKTNGVIARIGKQLLKQQEKFFELWHQFRQKELPEYEFLKQVKQIRKEIGELLEEGSYTNPSLKIAGFCNNLLTHFNSLWTFLDRDNVDPTNNHAERSLRHFVIWRKKYFCTRSDYGSEFVARSASLATTCKLQNKNPFQTLSMIVQNYFAGLESSHLFPIS
jgi:transposase